MISKRGNLAGAQVVAERDARAEREDKLMLELEQRKEREDTEKRESKAAAQSKAAREVEESRAAQLRMKEAARQNEKEDNARFVYEVSSLLEAVPAALTQKCWVMYNLLAGPGIQPGIIFDNLRSVVFTVTLLYHLAATPLGPFCRSSKRICRARPLRSRPLRCGGWQPLRTRGWCKLRWTQS